MSWVDDRSDEESKAKEDRAKIALYGEKLYEELWKEITNRVEDARNHNLPYSTNGSAYERTISRNTPGNRPFKELGRMTVSLDREEWKILVESDERSLSIDMALCKDEVVCLKHEGRALSVPEAARLVLEPFIFPH